MPFQMNGFYNCSRAGMTAMSVVIPFQMNGFYNAGKTVYA